VELPMVTAYNNGALASQILKTDCYCTEISIKHENVSRSTFRSYGFYVFPPQAKTIWNKFTCRRAVHHMHCPNAHAPVLTCFSGNQDSPTPSKRQLSGYHARLIIGHQHNKSGYHKVMTQLARMILGD
jgi:hypothetical protein